jgi:hypothetical protein
MLPTLYKIPERLSLRRFKPFQYPPNGNSNAVSNAAAIANLAVEIPRKRISMKHCANNSKRRIIPRIKIAMRRIHHRSSHRDF